MEMEFCSGADELIDIPKRPPWNYSLSKQELQNNEEKYFRVSPVIVITLAWAQLFKTNHIIS